MPTYGYVRLNGEFVWQSLWGSDKCETGVNIILVDPFNCSAIEPYRRFDTYSSPIAATELSNYLQHVESLSIIVGVTANEPTRYLQEALSTLSDLGADVSRVQHRGAFGFVAQKGKSCRTKLFTSATAEQAVSTPPRFSVSVKGKILFTSSNIKFDLIVVLYVP